MSTKYIYIIYIPRHYGSTDSNLKTRGLKHKYAKAGIVQEANIQGSNSYHYLSAIVQIIIRSSLKAHIEGFIAIYLQQPFINHSSGDFSPMCRENIPVKPS